LYFFLFECTDDVLKAKALRCPECIFECLYLLRRREYLTIIYMSIYIIHKLLSYAFEAEAAFEADAEAAFAAEAAREAAAAAAFEAEAAFDADILLAAEAAFEAAAEAAFEAEAAR
jgi:hypothetical protein